MQETWRLAARGQTAGSYWGFQPCRPRHRGGASGIQVDILYAHHPGKRSVGRAVRLYPRLLDLRRRGPIRRQCDPSDFERSCSTEPNRVGTSRSIERLPETSAWPPIQPAGAEVRESHDQRTVRQMVIAVQLSRSQPVGTSSVEALATSPEFARKECREYGLDHHGSRGVCHSHRISGEPLLLHRPDLAQSLPASVSIRSLRRRGEGPHSRNQTHPAHGAVDRDCASWFLHRQTSSRQKCLHPWWVPPCSETLPYHVDHQVLPTP